MLVVARKPGEEVLIGEGYKIRVVIVEVRGDKVRIGIDAPEDVSIIRRELLPEYKTGG